MNPVWLILFFAVFGGILSFAMKKSNNSRDNSPENIEKTEDLKAQITAQLEEGESIEVCCFYAAVTTKCLYYTKHDELVKIPFSEIKKLKATNFSASKTKNPEDVLSLYVYTNDGDKHTIINQSNMHSAIVIKLCNNSGISLS